MSVEVCVRLATMTHLVLGRVLAHQAQQLAVHVAHEVEALLVLGADGLSSGAAGTTRRGGGVLFQEGRAVAGSTDVAFTLFAEEFGWLAARTHRRCVECCCMRADKHMYTQHSESARQEAVRAHR